MRLVDLPPEEQWNDLFKALDFAEQWLAHWVSSRLLRQDQLAPFQNLYEKRRSKWSAARSQAQAIPETIGLPRGHAGESAASRSLRYWTLIERDIQLFSDNGLLPLARAHELLAEIDERQAALQRRLAPEDRSETVPMESLELEEATDVPASANPSESFVAGEEAPKRSRKERRKKGRNLLEILLDPRNIHMLLSFGGALMVVGLVILLWVNEFFTPPVVALGLGVINAAVMGAGWWVRWGTRYLLAGMGLTLLACLVMPLNLWYYHANQLITLDGHLWAAALAMSALYAASALVLRDELFVYVFMVGVTLTGLLFLADLPPSPQKLWEIASPATLLVVLGLLAIHIERAFAEQGGPFGRQRFGLAFFWSGHVLLAAGLLLVLGAEIAGNWLYEPIFKRMYQEMNARPSPIVNELRWLALALVMAGMYAYIYSDLVVRHVGVYVHVAAGIIVWALILVLELLHISPGMDALITALAVTALAVNGAQATVLRDNRYARSFPYIGISLLLLAAALGLVVYFRALSRDLRSIWPTEPPAWTYVGAMLLTAIAARVGAYLYRTSHARLAAVYFFVTAAATLLGVTALLAALDLNTWEQHAPLLMLVPIIYLIAARLYRGQPEELPLLWVSHAATVVMLISSLASAGAGFVLIRQQPLNLILALFFAEAAAFYALVAVFYRRVWTIHLTAAMACGALWQVLTYLSVAADFYTLTFALVGLALLVGYRFAVLERFEAGPLADAAFQSANTLLSLAFVAALFLGLSRLASDQIQWRLVGLFALLTAIGLLALVLVKHAAWRRWYVVTTIGQAALTFLGVTVLSELSPWQKLEIFSVSVGVLLLAAGHVGWYREQDRHSDLVTVALLLGSLLAGVPLAVATLIGRSLDRFLVLNELGFLAASVLLLTSGFLLKPKSTTLIGAALTAVYFLALLIFVPWSRLNAVGVFITAGGGTLFLLGLVLSIYRDRLLQLPERVKQREGLFRVLNWR